MSHAENRKSGNKCPSKNLSNLGLCPSAIPSAPKRLVSLDTPGLPFIIIMAKDPAFLFYFQDFLVGTEFMSAEEVGCYIRILCHLADKQKLSEKQIVSICRNHEFSSYLREKFIQDENGLFYNKRLSFEVEKRRSFCESRRISRSYVNKRTLNIRRTHVQRMENENENENKDINKIEIGKESMRGKPSLTDCKAYFKEIEFPGEADAYFDHFSSNGWKVGGKAAMKDWKAAARNWVRRSTKEGNHLTKAQQKTMESLRRFNEKRDINESDSTISGFISGS